MDFRRSGWRLAAWAALVVALAGCSFLSRSRSAPPVEPADGALDPLSAACLVGPWHQSEGWQRLDVGGQPLEIALTSGGADLVLAADGTGSVAYAAPAIWTGVSGGHRLEATFSGTGTLTYTASAGIWNAVADNTKIITNLTLDATADAPRNGSAGRATTGTYHCGDTELVISTDDTRSTYQR